MERKVVCPSLSVLLVKTIKTFCEVNIKYDQRLEISGSIHVRSDGEKVFTCLLDEETVKGQTDTASRVAELATRISLANAALTLQHVQGVNNPQQVAEALLFSMQGAVDLNSYFINPGQQAAVGGMEDGRTAMDDCSSASNAALRVSPISPAQDRSAVDLSLDDIRQKALKMNEQAPNMASMPRFSEASQRSTSRRVDTVAKTLAAIKASNASRIEANNAVANHSGQQNHVKLPDIKTLAMAHRLPSYQAVKAESTAAPNITEVGSAIGTSPILNTLSLSTQNSVTDVGMDACPKPDPNSQAAVTPSGQRKKFQCMFCGIFLSTKCYLKNHVNAMHTRSRIYQCELCEHFFYSAGAMRIHKLRNHWQGSKKHRCEHCGENFLLPIELRKHVQKKHFGTTSLVEPESTKLEPGEVPASRSQYLRPMYSMSAMTLSQAVLLPSNAMVPMTTGMVMGSDTGTE